MTDGLLSLSTDEFITGIDEAASRFDAAAYPQQYLPAEDWARLVKAGVKIIFNYSEALLREVSEQLLASPA